LSPETKQSNNSAEQEVREKLPANYSLPLWIAEYLGIDAIRRPFAEWTVRLGVESSVMVGTLFSYLDLLRVPLMCWGLALCLPWLMLSCRTTRPMLRGLLDLNHVQPAMVTFFSFLLSNAISLSASILLERGQQRFGLPALGPWFSNTWRVLWVPWNSRGITYLRLLLIILALLPSLLLFVVMLLECWRQRRRTALLFMSLMLPTLPMFVGGSILSPNAAARIHDALTLFILRPLVLSHLSTDGYLQNIAGSVSLAEEHVSAAGLLMVTILLCRLDYFAIDGFQILPARLLGWPQSRILPFAPALGSIVLLLTLLCLLMTAATFFLDRYHVPVLSCFVILLILDRKLSRGHVFRTYRLEEQVPDVTARVALQAAAASARGKGIVVCASGGGIHAAAWTAKVLTGLETMFEGEFGRRLRLISAVSGGSVGAMYFVASYNKGGPTNAVWVNDCSRASSLDAVVNGLVALDVPRMALGWLLKPWRDRGWILEKAWDPYRRLTYGLSAWRVGVTEGKWPAVLFNTTVVETGEAVAIGTVDLGERVRTKDGHVTKLGIKGPTRSFYEVYRDEQIDLPVTTAVRLSATFPLVTPAASPDNTPRSKRFHFVDGGYYDNYGVAAALQFLEEATLDGGGALKQILLVEIRATPAPERLASMRGGLFHQFSAPVRTMLAVRSEAQRARNDAAVRMAELMLRTRGLAG